MKKYCLFVDNRPFYLNNNFFFNESFDNRIRTTAYAFTALKKYWEKQGINLSTYDINSPLESEVVICIDVPHILNKTTKQSHQTWILFIYDPPIYCPESWDKRYHTKFDKVFTFDNTLVDNKKYFHYHFAIDTDYFKLPDIITEEVFCKRKFCTIVTSALQSMRDKAHPDSLLYERYKAISWFARYHPNDLDFYGASLEQKDYHFSFRGVSILKKLLPDYIFKSLARFIQRKLLKVYKGQVPSLDKIEVISNYKFYLCYENTKNIAGYVTEKFFETLYAGVVPVYWGPPNKKTLLPADCYINGWDFDSFEDIYIYMQSISFDQYLEYISASRRFLQGPELERFKVGTFIKTINSVLHPLASS